uniref:Uncharacterized protein n=1 Tax=Anguilla anguilla TaxID=7936 RepID=A0A0E9VFD5_ANGAN
MLPWMAPLLELYYT